MTICITPQNPFVPSTYKKSRLLSDIMLGSYVKATGCFNEGVMETDTMIANNWCNYPTTLIELGYMTNPDEDLKMNQDSYQITMANAIADALDLWFATMPKSELSMHPSLQEAQSGSADTSSTAETAGSGETGSGSADTDSQAR